MLSCSHGIRLAVVAYLSVCQASRLHITPTRLRRALRRTRKPSEISCMSRHHKGTKRVITLTSPSELSLQIELPVSSMSKSNARPMDVYLVWLRSYSLYDGTSATGNKSTFKDLDRLNKRQHFWTSTRWRKDERQSKVRGCVAGYRVCLKSACFDCHIRT